VHAESSPQDKIALFRELFHGREDVYAKRWYNRAVPEGEPLLIIATGKYIGEGFDEPRLDTLFLAMPFSWKGTLAQYVGRLHRNYE
jgi:superfamily II DNA or RNA helicase